MDYTNADRMIKALLDLADELKEKVQDLDKNYHAACRFEEENIELTQQLHAAERVIRAHQQFDSSIRSICLLSLTNRIDTVSVKLIKEALSVLDGENES